MRRLQIINSFDSLWNGQQAILGCLPQHTSKDFFFFFFFLAKTKKPSVRTALANNISSLLGAREEERKTQRTEREHWVTPSGLCSALVGLVSDILPIRDNHSPPLQNSRANQITTNQWHSQCASSWKCSHLIIALHMKWLRFPKLHSDLLFTQPSGDNQHFPISHIDFILSFYWFILKLPVLPIVT